MDHWNYQFEFRQDYIRNRTKAVRNDVSFHVDAGAANGLNHLPYYPEDLGAGSNTPFSVMLCVHNFQVSHSNGVA